MISLDFLGEEGVNIEEDLKYGDSHAPDVNLVGELSGIVEQDLWGHIRECACRALVFGLIAGNTEIGNFIYLVFENNIFRLDVSMDDLLLMDLKKPLAHVTDNGQEFSFPNILVVDDIPERTSAQLEDNIGDLRLEP